MMTNLFYGYDTRQHNITELLQEHTAKYGKPPSILINKNDVAAVGIPEARVDQYVMPFSIFLEILEVEDV
jgi:hypothetical protein